MAEGCNSSFPFFFLRYEFRVLLIYDYHFCSPGNLKKVFLDSFLIGRFTISPEVSLYVNDPGLKVATA